MATGFLVLVGTVGYSRLKITLLPDLQVPRIYMITRFPGMSPAEVEDMVSIPLEKAIAGTSGLRSLESRSERGISIIEANFSWNLNRDFAMVRLRQKLNRVYTTLPEHSSRPELIPYDPSREPLILIHAQSASLGKRLRPFIENVIQAEIEQIPGISAARINGGFRQEVQISLNRRRLYGSNMSVQSVVRAIQTHNISRSVGRVRTGPFERTIRIQSRATRLEDLRTVPVSGKARSNSVQLADLGSIQHGYSDRHGTTLVDGKEEVTLALQKEPTANAIKTSRAVHKALFRLNAKHRKALKLKVLEDQAALVQESIDSMKKAAIVGAMLAVLFLFLFLGSLRTAALVAVTVPVSIVISMGSLYFLGASLNAMSMAGLILGMGMLMDGSIIVTESIRSVYEHTQQGGLPNSSENSSHLPKLELNATEYSLCILNGTQKVLKTVIASTATTVIVFFPILFVDGLAAALFRDLAISVIVSLLAGLYCSSILIPVLHLLIGKRRRSNLPQPLRRTRLLVQVEKALTRIQKFYAQSLSLALQNPRFTILIAFASASLGILLINQLPRSIMPEQSPNAIVARLRLDPGTSFQTTARQAVLIQKSIVQSFDIVSTVIHTGYETDNPAETIQGQPGGNEATIIFIPGPDCQTEALLQRLRSMASDGSNRLLQARVRPGPIQRVLDETRGEYQLDIEGADSESKQIISRTARILRSLPGIRSVDTNFRQKPVIEAELNRKRAATSRITPMDAARTLRSSIQGNVASAFQDEDRTIDIRVRLQKSFRKENQIDSLKVPARSKNIPLSGLLDRRRTNEKPPRIRIDQNLVHRLRFQLLPDGKQETLTEVRTIMNEIIEKHHASSGDRVSFSLGPVNEKTRNSLESLFFAFCFSCVLVFQLLAAQFESILHSLGLILSVSSMILGAAMALFLTGQGVNISSAIGLIMLTGIVINASIALFEEISHRREHVMHNTIRNDETLRKSILGAGLSRVRAILLTVFTTLGGLLPVALAGNTAGNQKPMAIVIIGGLSLGTIAALIVFPCFYILIEHRDKRSK